MITELECTGSNVSLHTARCVTVKTQATYNQRTAGGGFGQFGIRTCGGQLSVTVV